MADKKGYYRILGIAVNATAGEIKAAYRVRAGQTHPDKNPGRDTTLEFQLVAEAYAVLCDPIKRAQYDASDREVPPRHEGRKPGKGASAQPLRCSSCGDATAQPRYVIFPRVVSYAFGSARSAIQGIFCPRCAWKKGLRASAVTWLFGWWGFPKGPFLTLHALARNFFGGIQPVDYNARLMAHQAGWFAAQNRLQLARSIAMQALQLARKAGNDELLGTLHAFLDRTNVGEPLATLRSEWAVFNFRAFAAQLALATGVIASAAAAWSEVSLPRESQLLSQLPRVSRGLAGAPLAPFRVVAPPGAESYIVKLVDPQTGQPVITLTVRGGDAAEVSVPLGAYKLKYAAGRLGEGEGAVSDPQTIYNEAAALMEFERSGGRLVGSAVELVSKGDGSPRTRRIERADF